MTRAVVVRISGRVQGVAFRMYAVREAARLELVGWVRNEPDGSVAAHLEGPDDKVAEMVSWCRNGPPAATVRGVEVEDVAPTGASSFEVAY